MEEEFFVIKTVYVEFLVIFHSANLKLAMLDTPVSSFISMNWPECGL